MAIKTKKSLFTKDVPPAEPAEQKESEEQREPYMVFDSKDDYDAAVAAELEKRGNNVPEEKAAEPAAAAPAKNEPPTGSGNDDSARVLALWQRDAAMLKLIVPEFDLNTAVKDETFRRVLTSGGSVFEAYAAAVRPGSAAGRDEIFQNAQTRTRGTGDAVVNPAKLSPEEFKKYIEERRNA
ncbi:MAG: hypothetical protein IJH37_09620 [Clostridia bacterium]|nr:hypothetical protein [Clostridia bacterium]